MTTEAYASILRGFRDHGEDWTLFQVFRRRDVEAFIGEPIPTADLYSLPGSVRRGMIEFLEENGEVQSRGSGVPGQAFNRAPFVEKISRSYVLFTQDGGLDI